MAYDHHDYVETPAPETRLWRYMELWKLLDLLSTRSLFHCRVDLLSDVYEGAVTEADQRRLLSVFEQVAHMYEGDDPLTPAQQTAEIVALHVAERQRGYVCCWNAIEPEHFALWHLYAEHGVAIQTSAGRLDEAITRPDGDHHLYLGRIGYIDHDSDEAGAGNMLRPFFRKRIEFQFEGEVRSLYHAIRRDGETRAGMTVSVEPSVLIERVVVSPFVPSAAVDAVASVCGALGLDAPVVASSYVRR